MNNNLIPESNALTGTENQLPTIKTLDSKKYYFSDLNDTQKQKLAEKLLNNHPMRLQNTLVEYVLAKSFEDTDAPFCFDDITNFYNTGDVEITLSNGNTEYLEDITEEDRDQKVEFLEHLKDRIDLVVDTLNDKLSDLEVDQMGVDDQESNLLQAEINKLNGKLERLEQKQYNLDKSIDDLNGMEFDRMPEIYQWFSCSDWLIHALDNKGQCTLNGEFWGRQCCGQSVTLDHVIQFIAYEWACDYENDYLTDENLKDLDL